MLRLRMTALILLIGALTACQISQPSENDPSSLLSDRPNILWLVAEDMGPYLASFGDSTISTPNLSRLAAEGVRYTHVYSPSGVCAPSRAAIATGMYPSSIGANYMRTTSYTEVTGLPKYEAVPPPPVRMFSQLLRQAGYYCSNRAKKDYQFRPPVTAWDESGDEAHWRNRATGQPFFSIFNFGVTHESGLFEPYERKTVIPEDLELPIPPYLPDNEIGKRDVWKMYNNIALLDEQVGKVLDQLEEDGLLEETIVMFYADHGGPLPRQKRLIYDAGLRVPMIIRFPDKWRAGSVEDQLISFIDFAPTMLGLAGQNPPTYLQGQSFLGTADHQRAYIHAAADRFDGFTDHIRAVRDGRFKYIRNYLPGQGYYLPVVYRERIPVMQELLRMRDAGELNEIQAQWFRSSKPREELFDCENDPHELVNLAEDPQYAEKLKELRVEMDRWLAYIGDQPDMEERALIQHLWNGEAEKPQTEEPILTESAGKLSIECNTSGASIGYRKVSSAETAGTPWEIYSEPIQLEEGVQWEIQAHRIGYRPSRTVIHPAIR
ncbi:sulfatase [Pontibacter sp. G13]|uniref:sulfatase family protein n=1 Tax=Pontibacter sp. G13 TaxID=3074898 RepID=UPI00288937B0|nr:sulfatase [Pontibacter sp. G13]WNJ17276.1 sulfatase [Pontibacter sp. G13]